MTTITLEFDRENLHSYTDEFLAALWHAAQAQSKPFGDKEACETTETIGREIIRRFLACTPPALYHFQGRDINFERQVIAQVSAAEQADGGAA